MKTAQLIADLLEAAAKHKQFNELGSAKCCEDMAARLRDLL